MATNKEIGREDMRKLFELLEIQHAEGEEAMKKALLRLINHTKSSMTKEDIAWVEQQVQDTFKA